MILGHAAGFEKMHDFMKKMILDFDDFQKNSSSMLDFDDFGACCWILMILKKMLAGF